MLLKDLLSGIKVKTTDFPAKLKISSITCDSRKVSPNCLFVAIPGTKVDGTKFIKSAVEKGARAVVLEKEADVPEGTVKILVDDARSAFAQIAANYYGNPSQDLIIIGITGTNGKTTVTYLIEAILKAAGFTVGVIGTIGARIGAEVIAEGLTTPSADDLQEILYKMKKRGVSHVVMEVSSHALAQGRVIGVDFDLAVFTNLTQDHLDYHKTMDAYLADKRKLFEGLGKLAKKKTFAIINADDAYARNVLGKYSGKVITYSIEKPSNLKATNLKVGEGLSFGADDITVNSELLGLFNIYNLLAAVQVGLALGIDQQVVQEAVKSIKVIPGRMEEIKTGKSFRVFVDFAHTPDALEKVLKAAQTLNTNKGKIILVFGCPGERDRTKRPIMGKIAVENADQVIATTDDPHSENPENIIEEVTVDWETDPRLSKVVDRRQAIEKALRIAQPNDIVLIAGRGHEKYQDFNGKKVEINDRKVVKDILGA
ncbi:MAG: UDP-N-acetylmuramoyl-L-alanyl-D-glutamate--2,6-diaminopimelate ligase [Candidatus Margulisbacteria bacterium]|nr:UDP-N-acetylmuramoyl-L-alanyl-D-glutamate--2,6-diaminopimelate ligase [Candidatus Margulisiibacteriota bacterium]MBU1022464.1 UDP-N-acetylmuramoyl-L-alanyl-D-glutamate--2,6-diaminopimelate ligase [Candidatus Margulisiibacteriota bacterium]MBU1728448.1 UDP-N-acetylmuramoyl-L-alanyl-D-glutamate--2,6-diaminopimelate ligase [Candidatus Margulisiibacteriota bacterium]MBU1954595.1 UDP-N-acetylmuramoyl-L-alanyl-D-glutamate--2,6-diaminopimelate ligase [Candidatus Margulisiibacteriota bacterium]